ncbi:GTP-binding protein TypA/BipA [Thermanaerovibrio velox DSM 12556]|uniref:Large ribosomal subunit assembly factor BipA n=1 Tax=Thermanaerovibrio velox DSM 12556 TaxID=926567 RepID=H0USN2_9BACT|nr:translational GTPase TypA [Thermanaerovibrio velox]EHM10321.1 GTP-binding protein TypA/BipA [Thermanaerovibrio velox DSM 12556]
MKSHERIRNVAIIAHIDHGKTTLIDSIFKAARTFRENARLSERIMDSNDLERERGITIKAKHCTVTWGDYTINIVDTPGHADFSGEVERVLSLVDSALLLVDAVEGPMPQTRYVLSRALKMGLRPIVIVNKVDRPHGDPSGALNKTFDLFVELGASDEQCDFPILYGSGLNGWVVKDLDSPREGMDDLFDTVIRFVPPPKVDPDGDFLMQVCTLAWSDYLGQIGCGKILSGTLKRSKKLNQVRVAWTDRQNGSFHTIWSGETSCEHLFVTQGLERVEVEEAHAGDIVWFSGPDEIALGDTFMDPTSQLSPLPPLDVEEPTVSMFFLVNNGPFAGKEGQAVTLRQLKARLERESKTDVALKVEDVGRHDGLKVSGRGELHLAILIEEMRREGMEFCVSRPEVITSRDENGDVQEPVEELTIDVPEEFQGTVIQKLALRKGELVSMENHGTGTIRLNYVIPTRGLIGYRGEFLTDTKGLGTMSSRVIGHAPWAGEISGRSRGSMVSVDDGQATSYALENLQVRGTLFISPGEEVYCGMVVGEHSRGNDLPCNPAKRKQLTNHRSATKDATVILDAPKRLTVEGALEWIADDELVEITPSSIRIRKAILDPNERKKAAKGA